MPAALHVYVPNVDEVHARAVNAGGTSVQEPTDKFYGERSSAVKDPVGNCWYIATLVEELTDNEIDARMSKLA
jgi:PhnB protein